ncbi:homoserine O-acetyltransferase family protein [Algoriphagus machipongonensis]|uniref:Homoserine O-acetyltransferase n=1 Tax=Algoriphagus machipongonensis TaxID=388413 RepID=A3HST3_9BACT|nr:homoserine O-acetyltransferase [Algoriphagus machipongonensis]EAZ82901.2 homoserine O-acetyltransferase [Algoriphagus machipongonensis]
MNLKSQFASITMSQDLFHSNLPLELESGEILPEYEISYTSYGELNADKSNVVWVIHALTGDSNVSEWWSGLIGEDKFFDPSRHFIICANLLGSCYGSTNPLSINPKTGQKYFYDFPELTTRDLAKSLDNLRNHLGIHQIHTLIGGSLGGQISLEWAYILGEKLSNVVVLASTAKSSPWVIGLNESQRMAIESDQTWGEKSENAGIKGLEAARSIAMLSYRHPEDFQKKQSDLDEKLDGFRASSYIRYQGHKITKRFNALSYWILSKTMDSHDVGRGRGGAGKAIGQIEARVLAIGVDKDLLFLSSESKYIAQHAKRGTFREINSTAGHDAFLIEFEQLAYILQSFYLENN